MKHVILYVGLPYLLGTEVMAADFGVSQPPSAGR